MNKKIKNKEAAKNMKRVKRYQFMFKISLDKDSIELRSRKYLLSKTYNNCKGS
jgi:hypothetical protein